MKRYTIGLITGALLTISAMMFMGSQNKNLGDITVKSIKVKDGSGKMALLTSRYLSLGRENAMIMIVCEDDGGTITTYNADGKQTAYLGTGENGVGFIETYNADGKKTAYLGTGESDIGFLKTFNNHGVNTGYFGTNTENDGIAILFDRYGDAGWSASGKK